MGVRRHSHPAEGGEALLEGAAHEEGDGFCLPVRTQRRLALASSLVLLVSGGNLAAPWAQILQGRLVGRLCESQSRGNTSSHLGRRSRHVSDPWNKSSHPASMAS